jgi:hypothetical protein
MKLIGAGLPRTATTTQKIALEMLGVGPCYHMRDLFANPDDIPLWEEALDGPGQWDRLFDGWQSAVDWPASYHWRELMDVYPDAKVLLSVRSPEGWWQSMNDTILKVYFGDSVMYHVCRARYHVDENWRRWYDLMARMNWMHGGAWADVYNDRLAMIEWVNRWHDEVKSTVPADRLLVWEPKDGWEPLCELLDVPVPDEPLPWVNDTEGFHEMITGGGVQALHGWWEQEHTPAAVA